MTSPNHPPNTLEQWAHAYLISTDLDAKFHPPPIPETSHASPRPIRIARPGRPPHLRVEQRGQRTPGAVALAKPERRAQVVHTFLHHELQAAELMCWAVLAFPETPRSFRRGLLAIATDEVRHMNLYREHLEFLGARFGDFPVRDWFWDRVPASLTPAHFVAVMGMGFEGGNLDHAKRFAQRFRDVGDHVLAEIQETICAEEVSHVRFAERWFRRWTGSSDFDTWVKYLPPPLSPITMKGRTLNRADRARAGLSETFLDELTAWFPA